ncbi:MAG: peroxide stress protein YaaA [Chitinophagales bacterium]
MIALISPAKSLNLDSPILVAGSSEPVFHLEKQPIVDKLSKLQTKDIMKTFGLSQKLAELNFERFQDLGSEENLNGRRPCVFTFDGEVYHGLDAYTMNQKELEFAQSHLRILSGLYGSLRPMDLIEPYRLEMGIKIGIGRKKNLYEFWREKVSMSIHNDLQSSGQRSILNLASNEYFKVIDPKIAKASVIEFDFLEEEAGELKNISFYSKKARGLMARYLITNEISKLSDIQGFHSERYLIHSNLSTPSKFVFTRKFEPIGKKNPPKN